MSHDASVPASGSSTPDETRYPGGITPADVINPLPPRHPLPSPTPLSQPEDELQFFYLADRPEFLKPVTEAIYEEWKPIYVKYYFQNSLEECIEFNRHFMNRHQLNSCLVGTIDGEFACTAMLVTDDMPLDTVYYGTRPWLASVVVTPKFRGRGVFTRLIKRMMDLTKEFGFERLWLQTQHMQPAYRKLGFKTIETIDVFNGPYTVMRCDFNSPPQWTEADAKKAHQKLHPHDSDKPTPSPK